MLNHALLGPVDAYGVETNWHAGSRYHLTACIAACTFLCNTIFRFFGSLEVIMEATNVTGSLRCLAKSGHFERKLRNRFVIPDTVSRALIVIACPQRLTRGRFWSMRRLTQRHASYSGSCPQRSCWTCSTWSPILHLKYRLR